MKDYLLIPICFVLAFSCKKDPPVVPPPPQQPTIAVKAEDASCTEAWLTLTTAEAPATIRLVRDNQRITTLRLLTSDSLLVDEGLLPNRAYTYQLQKLGSDSGVIETSASVQVTTMDTTSHNFTWQIDTLGDGNSSVLYDVAIINDTLAYAVGEIYKRDSLGNWESNAYNMVKWDGNSWNLRRIPYIYQGSPFYGPIRYLLAFGSNDIWFGNSTRWNGQQFSNVSLGGSVFVGIGSNKMWGNAGSGELYVVGNSGTIAYSADRGNTWRQLSSGTTLPIQDVYGSVDTRSRKTEVLAVASDPWHGYAKKIIGISAQSTTAVSDSGIPEPLSGVWFTTNRKYYTVGSGIFTRLNLNRGNGSARQTS